MSLYKSQGLGHDSDGILGLSPHKDMKKKKLHYLWSLKDNGIIDRAMVSFSIASKEMEKINENAWIKMEVLTAI